MKCPACGYKTVVLSTRNFTDRRRQCTGPLSHRMTTREVVTVEPVEDLAAFRIEMARVILRAKGYLV